MRKLMWFSVGFAAACFAGIYLLPKEAILIAGAVTLVCMLLCIAFWRRWCAITVVVIILLGATVGLCWLRGYDHFYLRDARKHDGGTITATIEVIDYSVDSGYGTTVDGIIKLETRDYRVRFYINENAFLRPGDKVTGSFLLRQTVGGGAREATYHQGHGIFLLAYPRGEVTITYAADGSAKFFAAELRREIKDMVNTVFPEDTAAFARALLLGDTSGLTYEDDTAFKVSGIRHVVAVSGLHVSILFSMAYSLVGKKRVLTALIGIPLLVLFAAVAGFTPSITRACVMQALMILAMLFNKEYDPPTALGFSVLVMLAVNPWTVTSVSFQLSVGCMLGIFLFSEGIRTLLLGKAVKDGKKNKTLWNRLRLYVANSVSVTLSAMLITTPLSAYYFGTVSLIGILTNLITLWVVTFAFCAIAAACALGALWIPLGQGIAWLAAWPIRYILLISKLLSAVPNAAVYTCSVYILAWLVLCYVLLAAFALCKCKHPVVLSCCMIFSLALSLGASWLEPKLDNYRVTVLDVGQGQCIILQSGDRHYLADCGGNNAADSAAQRLLSQGVDQIDGLFLTHYDEDHAGDAANFLTRIDCDRLYLPDIEPDNPLRKQLAFAYADKISWINENIAFGANGVRISVYPSQNRSGSNESGMCLLFQMNNCDILITGDWSSGNERQLVSEQDLPRLELLIAGHHGSNSSTSFELLSETMPHTAIISVGKNNSFGHPSREVLDRLEMFGCQIYRTDTDGTVIIKG